MDGVIRAAIVGTGWIATEHVLALRGLRGVEVVAVSSASPDRARQFAEHHGIATAVAPHAAVMAGVDCDVVHVCSTNADHYEICRSAVALGKHVVCEKPLAVSSQQSLDLTRQVSSMSSVHATNYNYRAYPMVQHARELIAAGELGEIHLVHGRYAQDWLLFAHDYNWRLDPERGGISAAVGDVGGHWLDLAEHVCGLPITEVFARLRTAVPERSDGPRAAPQTIHLDDSAILSLAFEGGALGGVVVSQISAGRKNDLRLEVAGSKGSLAWSQEAPDQLWVGHRNRPSEVMQRAPDMDPDDPLPAGHPFGWRDALRRNLGSVYRRVQNQQGDRDVPFATFIDGHRGLVLLEAVVQSAAQGAPVPVGPGLPAPAAGSGQRHHGGTERE